MCDIRRPPVWKRLACRKRGPPDYSTSARRAEIGRRRQPECDGRYTLNITGGKKERKFEAKIFASRSGDAALLRTELIKKIAGASVSLSLSLSLAQSRTHLLERFRILILNCQTSFCACACLASGSDFPVHSARTRAQEVKYHNSKKITKLKAFFLLLLLPATRS